MVRRQASTGVVQPTALPDAPVSFHVNIKLIALFRVSGLNKNAQDQRCAALH